MTPKSSDLSTTLRLVGVPVLISLVITLWRLTGELLAWSESWFNPAAGGFGAIVGITWLAPLFGVYFAWKLSRDGRLPSNRGRAIGLAAIGLLTLFAGIMVQPSILQRSYPAGLIFIWLVGITAAAALSSIWPELFKVLFAYGMAVRVPVVVIMFLAMWGRWETHYDAIPPGFPEMGWFGNFVWLGFFPQILLWVGFTIVTGMFFGVLYAAFTSRLKT
jgi:hypothetical protein